MDTTYSLLPHPTSAELEWLFATGVPVNAMAEPWPIKSAKVRFFKNGTFDFDREGHQAIILLAHDLGKAIDLIAWRAPSRGIASWRDAAFCLGDLDDVFNPATYFAGGALTVHASPLEWLRAGRDGIVIIRPELSYIYLARCRRLLVSDVQFAAKVRHWVQPPRPNVEIIVADTAWVLT